MSRFIFAGLASALFLQACTHVPVTSMIALARIDFERTDLSALRAAMRFPENFRARGSRMVIKAIVEGAPELREEFALEAINDPDELMQLSGEGRGGMRLAAFRLPAEAIGRFELHRKRTLDARREKRKGSLSIALEPDFCYEKTPPRDRLLFSTYLKTVETVRYVPVLRDFDAFSQKEYGERLRAMPAC